MTLVILLILGLALFLATRRRPQDAHLGGRVAKLEARVIELERLVHVRTAPTAAPRPAPPPRPTAPPRPRVEAPSRVEAPPPRPARPRPPRPPRAPAWQPKFSAADLMGAKALAFAGGIITMLGVVFFFVLAANRGWIGPELRVGAGALASALVFASGLWLRRRYGTTYSALAAVGVGIAGAYASLLAAVALYELMSKGVALAVAAAIASIGVAVSLRWSAQIVAGFGLIGAMAVPATLVLQGGLRQIGTGFVAIVFGASIGVAVQKRWWRLLQAGAIVSVPQALAQVAAADHTDAAIVVLAAAFWILYLAAGLAFQLRLGRVLAAAPASFLTGSAVFAGVCGALLYSGTARGVQMLAVAAVYTAVGAALFPRVRELGLVVGVLGLTLTAIGLADAISGSSLTSAWAAEAAVLAWLGSRLRDTRLQVPAAAYLVLATVHVLAVEASPDHLFDAFRHPAKGAPAVLAVAVAAVVFARVRRSWEAPPARGILRFLEPFLASLRRHERRLDVAGYALASVAAAYAASLGILELFQIVLSDDSVRASFEWGHVAVTATWSAAAVAAVVFALRAASRPALVLALTGVAVTILKAFFFDVDALGDTQRGISVSVVGVAALAAGLARQVQPRELTVDGAVALVVSLALTLAGGLMLWPSAYIVLLVGGAYVALSAVAFPRRRDLSTILWALGLATTAVAAGLLLQAGWLVLAYGATSAALAALSIAVRERRLQLAAAAYLGLAGFWTIVFEAPPADLLTARAQPGAGLPSVLVVTAATAVLVWALGWHARLQAAAEWVVAALGLYGASLGILEATQQLSPAGVQADFQRGQPAVSALWGFLALVLLYVGLKQRRAVLKGGGFILFAISVGKIFLLDLPSLSSAQRALSFLAVGAVLLLGGFFYQRLSSQYDESVA